MLKFIMRRWYKDINIENKDLFYDIYKWEYALPIIIQARYLVYSLLLYIISLSFSASSNMYIIVAILLSIAIFFFIAHVYENNKRRKNYIVVSNLDFRIRGIKLEEKMRKLIVLLNTTVLSRNNWKQIKEFDYGLYNDLLSDECNGCCYYYSKQICIVVKDLELIWCAISDPFDKNNFYAHAIVIKDNYIYDTNLRISYNFIDYAKFYNLKIYKRWSYNEYSKENFEVSIRKDFRNWCIQNNVSAYKNF